MTEPNLKFVSGNELLAELRIRRSPWLYQSVPHLLASGLVDQGWEVERTNKATTRLRKKKAPDRALEDDVWSLLARVGFTQLSQGRLFQIPIATHAGKQIDVLAADDETVLVVECKTSATVGPRSMAKDLTEAQGLRGPVSQALRLHFKMKKRVGWLFATRNIVWGKPDRARADEYRIRVLTDNDLDYFLKLADLIGPAARHQLQAEIFGNQAIEGLKRTVPAVRGRIGGRRFFQFAIDPERLLKIAFISHRARLDADSIGAYQRMLKRGRLAAIRRFIDDGGVFPTNVVLNFRTRRRFDASAEKPEGDVSFGTMYLPNTYKSAWIIDGQHRLYGFAGSKWAASTQLPVLAFEELPPAEEAEMFVDINSKQVRVSRNLLVELMSELYWDSPVAAEAFHALLSRIVAVLGREVGSPLRNRTVQEGEPQSPAKPLTTAALYEALKKTALIGTMRKGVFQAGPMYEQSNQGALLRSVAILSRYFAIFADELPDHWARGNGEGGYLCTNNGVTALLLVLEAVVDHLDQFGNLKPWQATPEELSSRLRPYIQPVVETFANAQPTDIRQFRRQVGNVGQRQSALSMMQAIRSAKPGFDPPGLDEYIKSQDQTGTNQARLLMPQLQLKLQDATLRLLRDKFGPGDAGWWRKGVPENVRAEVAARREASPTGGDLEQYFELIDYKSIANRQWDIFQPYFSHGGGKSKDAQLSWMQRLNEIRNRIAHPERGAVSDEELGFIEQLMEHFDNLSSSLPPD